MSSNDYLLGNGMIIRVNERGEIYRVDIGAVRSAGGAPGIDEEKSCSTCDNLIDEECKAWDRIGCGINKTWRSWDPKKESDKAKGE